MIIRFDSETDPGEQVAAIRWRVVKGQPYGTAA